MTKTTGLKTVGVAFATMMLAIACSGGSSATTAPVGLATPAPGQFTLGFSNAFGIGNGFREEQLCTARAQALKSGKITAGSWIHQNNTTYPQLQQFRDLIAKHPSRDHLQPEQP